MSPSKGVCHEILQRHKREMEASGLIPRRFFLSPEAHERIILDTYGPGNHRRMLFEIFGVPVTIDKECPPGTGYLMAFNEEEAKELKNERRSV